MLEYYIKMESAITDVLSEHPERLAEVINAAGQEVNSCKEVNRVSGNMDFNVQYFYAAFAMSCLFASFIGMWRTTSSCADLSEVGKRRGVSSANKIRIAFAEFFASLLVQTVIEVIFWCYLQVVLGIEVGTKILPILLLLISGSACGIGIGMCIGAVTGIALEVPVGYAGLIYARSGLACKRGLAPANKVGVVDSDYRGQIMVALHNHGSQSQTVENGERIAQMVITPVITPAYTVVDELSESDRGVGGFGSTGSK